MRGTIIRVFPTKGFGFIRGEDGVNRFFHASWVVPAAAFDRMREGKEVKFTPITQSSTVEAKGNGEQATDIRLCD